MLGEGNKSVCNLDWLGFREVVVHSIFSFCLGLLAFCFGSFDSDIGEKGRLSLFLDGRYGVEVKIIEELWWVEEYAFGFGDCGFAFLGASYVHFKSKSCKVMVDFWKVSLEFSTSTEGKSTIVYVEAVADFEWDSLSEFSTVLWSMTSDSGIRKIFFSWTFEFYYVPVLLFCNLLKRL